MQPFFSSLSASTAFSHHQLHSHMAVPLLFSKLWMQFRKAWVAPNRAPYPQNRALTRVICAFPDFSFQVLEGGLIFVVICTCSSELSSRCSLVYFFSTAFPTRATKQQKHKPSLGNRHKTCKIVFSRTSFLSHADSCYCEECIVVQS